PFAAVEGEPAEQAFEEGVGGEAAGGLAAQAVQISLVTLDRAGEGAQSGRAHEPRDQRGHAGAKAGVMAADEGRAAEGRIATAAQVEVALPGPRRVQIAAAE